MSNFLKGSEWRKWDLHVHTKNTNKNDQFKSSDFNEFCVKFFTEAILHDIKVIGITDYFSIENYKQVKKFQDNIESNNIFDSQEKEKIKEIYLIPNVELRMLPSTDKGKLINIHCLFNPNYIDNLEDDFFTTLEFNCCKMTKTGMTKLGRNLNPQIIDDEVAYKNGVNNFVVTPSDIQKMLNDNNELRKNTIVVVSNSNHDGASGLQKHYALFENDNSSSLDAVRRTIYNISDMIFSPNESDIKYFLGEKNDSKETIISKCGSLKACIHGSDAHIEEKLFKPDGNKYCWIKAKPTFEGLKQVIFEPKSRVYIGVNKPIEPIHKIENISLDFPEEYVWNNEKFCFSGKNSITFNPYLTSIIGGRGTGKSTLLNLIGKKLGFNSEFFDKVIINDENLIINPIAINNIEFLPQNEIDKFAKDSHAFTLAIFNRIDKLSNNILSKFENDNIENLNKFNSQIYNIKELENLKIEKESEDKKLIISKNIISTFQDEIYLDNKKELDKCVKIITEITNSRELYKNLYENLKRLSEDFLLIEEKNEYDKFFNELKTDLDNTYNKFKNKNYDEIKLKLKDLDDEKNEYNQIIESFLQEKGFDKESIKDLSNASENILLIENKINNLTNKISNLESEINAFSFHDKNLEYKILVDNELSNINKTFKEIQEKNLNDVKLIQINYKFSNNINEQVFNKLVVELEIGNKISSIRSTFSEYLFKVSIEQALELQTYEELKEKLSSEIKQTNTKTYSLLDEIMFNEKSFKIYKLIIQQTMQDFGQNKILEVLYDNKTLDKASFGQRCTSAIVILISLGNNPIIIDEPEAHLDSSLIANYLVELIKEKKKQRQIIFATHNANFVLNADSELIIKLDNIDGKTVCTSFSIEDLEHRDSLLKLEGGIEAFKKRERKYNIN